MNKRDVRKSDKIHKIDKADNSFNDDPKESPVVKSIEEKRREVRVKKNRAKLLAVVLIAVIFLAGPTLIKLILGNDVKTEIISIGSIEQSFSSNGFFIRSETLLHSSRPGVCVANYDEGDKIAANSKVAIVVESDAQNIIEQIKSLEERISLAKEEQLKNNELFKDDISKIEAEIQKIIQKMANISISKNMQEYENCKKELNILIQKKSDILNNGGDGSSFLSQLENEKATLENSVKDKTSDIVSEKPGLISYTIDGFEKSLTPEILEGLNCDKFQNLLSDVVNNNVQKGNEYDNAYAKLVDAIDYYFVCETKTINVDNYDNGDVVTVRLNDNNMIVPMSIYSIRKEESRSLVILKTTRMQSELITKRYADVEIIRNDVTGLKVRSGSIFDYNNLTGTGKIACIQNSVVTYITVNVVVMDDNYAIIENIETEDTSADKVSLNDILVLNPDNVKEGQLIT